MSVYRLGSWSDGQIVLVYASHDACFEIYVQTSSCPPLLTLMIQYNYIRSLVDHHHPMNPEIWFTDSFVSRTVLESTLLNLPIDDLKRVSYSVWSHEDQGSSPFFQFIPASRIDTWIGTRDDVMRSPLWSIDSSNRVSIARVQDFKLDKNNPNLHSSLYSTLYTSSDFLNLISLHHPTTSNPSTSTSTHIHTHTTWWLMWQWSKAHQSA